MLRLVKIKTVIICWKLTEKIYLFFEALTLARNTPRLLILYKALALVIKAFLLLLRLFCASFSTTEMPLKRTKTIFRFSSKTLFC